MGLSTSLLACLGVLSSRALLWACGGCTDAVLLMTLPWAGFGILLVWLWSAVMFVARRRLRRRGADGESSLVRSSTLTAFAVLGSVGYVALVFLTMGSVLVPSLFVGCVWAVYLIVRLAVDAVRFLRTGDSDRRTPLRIHYAFLILATALIAYKQTQANTLDHRIRCLQYGRHTELFSKIMPIIVAEGREAVGPLMRATSEAVDNHDGYSRMNTMQHATFCLGCIGGPEAEKFLSELIQQHANPSDYYDLQWYRGACFAYARCAGPRAADDLVGLFEKMPHSEQRDDRLFLLVALAVTGSKRGIAFTLDHMDLLLQRIDGGGNGSERDVVQATAERLAFGTNSQSLRQLPVYRDCVLTGATWLAEPRPNDYTSEFFWTAASEARLRPAQEIRAEWKANSASIRKRWMEVGDGEEENR